MGICKKFHLLFTHFVNGYLQKIPTANQLDPSDVAGVSLVEINHQHQTIVSRQPLTVQVSLDVIFDVYLE